MNQEIYKRRSGIIPLTYIAQSGNKKMNSLVIKLTKESSTYEINIALAICDMTKRELAERLKVTPSAVTMAVNGDQQFKKLKDEIIEQLNTLQGIINAKAS